MSLKKNDPRVVMYRQTRETLAGAITFSDEERRQKLEAKKQALETTKENQMKAVNRTAKTLEQAERAMDRIEELYEKELREIDEQLAALG